MARKLRGRPPVTRRRVLTYIRRHQPNTIMQIVRATGADRRHVQRIIRAIEAQTGEPLLAVH